MCALPSTEDGRGVTVLKNLGGGASCVVTATMSASKRNQFESWCVLRWVVVSLVWMTLAGCAANELAAHVAKASLALVGMSPSGNPTVTDGSAPSGGGKLVLRIAAGKQLNTDPGGRSLSVVVRVYKLKDVGAFLMAPYDAFRTTRSEREAFGSDVIDEREFVLMPGHKSETVEAVPSTVAYVGVVALLRTPAPNRWRVAFDARGAERTGIVLGVLDCALIVANGDPVGDSSQELRMVGMRCP